MTTRIHVVNLGPDAVEFQKFNPCTNENSGLPIILYSGDSVNEYVYDIQSIKVVEKKHESGR